MEESKPSDGAEAPAEEQPSEKKDDAEMTNEEGEQKWLIYWLNRLKIF